VWVRWAAWAAAICFGLVGETAAHGLRGESQLACLDRLTVNVDFAVGPEQCKSFSGLVDFTFRAGP